MAKGSIERRGEISWRLTVDLGENADGSRNRPRKPIELEDAALIRASKKGLKLKDSPKILREFLADELAAFKQEVLSGTYVKPEKITFKQFVDKHWGPKYAGDPENLSPPTYDVYKRHLKNHILPVFGHKTLDQIKPMHMVDFFENLKKPGNRKDKKKELLSGGTRQVIYRTVKNVLSRALEWRFIIEHPMENTPKPKADSKEPEFYEEEEAVQIIATLQELPEVWRLYFLGAIMGGFRRGELTALEWTEVDFQRNQLRIKQNIPFMRKGNTVIRKPKKDSKGIVDMPAWYMDALKQYYLQWRKNKLIVGDKWQGGDREFVFHGGYGKNFYYSYPSERWKKFTEKYGLKHIPLHGLRHSAATLLLEEGADMKAIQERLRHASKKTTEDLYVHVSKRLSRQTADKLEKFNPKNSSPIRPQLPNSKK